MIERHVYLRLTPTSRSGDALAQVIARSHALAELEGVRTLRVLRAADQAAQAAWDLCMVILFDNLSDYQRFREHPAHRAYVDEFLQPHIQVIKAWNLEE